VTVFVATGTTGFDDLAEAMDRLAAEIEEPVIIQIGAGKYVPRRAEHFRLAPSLNPCFQTAGLVVAHGGLGACMEALEAGKRLVAVNNPDRYDNHQDDLLTALEAAGHLIYCRKLDELPSAIERALRTEFKPYERPEITIHIRIKEFLSELTPRRSKGL
jgi:UDP-N-acetylglucosamine transferase subunit ALG13